MLSYIRCLRYLRYPRKLEMKYPNRFSLSHLCPLEELVVTIRLNMDRTLACAIWFLIFKQRSWTLPSPTTTCIFSHGSSRRLYHKQPMKRKGSGVFDTADLMASWLKPSVLLGHASRDYLILTNDSLRYIIRRESLRRDILNAIKIIRESMRCYEIL